MWRPTASFANLHKRAQVLAQLRQFFADKNILEVETPLLSLAASTDSQLHSFVTEFQDHQLTQKLYLQTSPEFEMKRLLAAGSGSIYQICKSFRNGEKGRHHNPEFSMLEWYRVDFDHHQLMDDVDELLQRVLNCKSATRNTYADIFLHHCDFDPHTVDLNELPKRAADFDISLHNSNDFNRDTWLDLFMTHVIEPRLGLERPAFIYDYPASQAMLARVRSSTPPVAERFEVYVQGIELANGFHELADAAEQRKRFVADLEKRKQLKLPAIPIDEKLLSALEQGLPNCAGIALGVDRLVMLATQAERLADVVAFYNN